MNHVYHQLILEHNRTPSNRGALAGATHIAEVFNPTCGDRIRVDLRIDTAGRLERIAFDGDICAVATASASLMTEALDGGDAVAFEALAAEFRRFIEAGEPLTHERSSGLEPLGSVRDYPGRKRCATLPWEALVEAVYNSKEETDA